MDDSGIIELYWQRDEQALAETRQKYGKNLKTIAGRLGLSQADCEEIENETYLTAWNRIPPAEPRTYFFGFLAKITREKAINRLKSARREKRDETKTVWEEEIEECFAAQETVENTVGARELTKAIEAFLKSVSEEKRKVFLRRYWFMDSVADIARRYKMTEGKVKSLLFRTRNELKDYLRKEGFTL